ncbi:hypothetical protein CYJ95_11035 [Micrococcus luteus]|uniref:Uncharacterized protein n=1 Tax=Micrococcus luteus TaxID=1270 RepID=A0AAX0VHW4_MICLU|nr:hypothetical protein CYJ95_11035 [Micrococcus luteus]
MERVSGRLLWHLHRAPWEPVWERAAQVTAELEAVAQDVAAARRGFGLASRPVPESEGAA